MAERIWGLDGVPALERPDLLAPPVAAALKSGAVDASRVLLAEVDPELADTAACCDAYDVPPEASGNCVVVRGKRGGDQRMAACVILATTRADVNGAVRRRLDVRKASFAPQEDTVAATGMEYGGITPIGLPAEWPVLVDPAAAAAPRVLIGAGTRAAKLIVPGDLLAVLPAAEVLDGLGIPA